MREGRAEGVKCPRRPPGQQRFMGAVKLKEMATMKHEKGEMPKSMKKKMNGMMDEPKAGKKDEGPKKSGKKKR